MPINEAIITYLTSRREQALALVRADPTAAALLADFERLTIKPIVEQYVAEISQTAEEWWHLLDADKPIDAILFEYGYLDRLDPEADLYGLRFDDVADLKVQAEQYFIDYQYDMPMEALPDITLNLLNPLHTLPMPGQIQTYNELREAYLFTAYIALHHAAARIIQTDAYRGMHHRLPFHFLIQEHDNGLTYPIYISAAV